jgi:hypothetical protein
MSDRRYFSSTNKYGVELKEAEGLDLEMHARLEAGLLDSRPLSCAPLMVGVGEPDKPSMWQTLRKFFH